MLIITRKPFNVPTITLKTCLIFDKAIGKGRGIWFARMNVSIGIESIRDFKKECSSQL
jgi:hypothetical protein